MAVGGRGGIIGGRAQAAKTLAEVDDLSYTHGGGYLLIKTSRIVSPGELFTDVFVAYDRGVNESMFWVLASLLTLVVLASARSQVHSGSRDRGAPG